MVKDVVALIAAIDAHSSSAPRTRGDPSRGSGFFDVNKPTANIRVELTYLSFRIYKKKSILNNIYNNKTVFQRQHTNHTSVFYHAIMHTTSQSGVMNY